MGHLGGGLCLWHQRGSGDKGWERALELGWGLARALAAGGSLLRAPPLSPLQKRPLASIIKEVCDG